MREPFDYERSRLDNVKLVNKSHHDGSFWIAAQEGHAAAAAVIIKAAKQQRDSSKKNQLEQPTSACLTRAV
jgi:hypothetical protein